MIKKNQTWELTDKPENRTVIGLKWIFKRKENPDGSLNKLKARLVVKVYSQIPGVDFVETFAPVARYETLKLLIALAAQNQWQIYHLDVKSAFLNGKLDEDIYVEQPAGFVIEGADNKVYKLKKALYCLKQAPRAWYSCIDSHLHKLGFKRSKSEFTLYVRKRLENVIIVSIYVDDILIIGNVEQEIAEFKEEMQHDFEMSDLGIMSYFLGIEIEQLSNGIFLSQRKYISSILRKFGMENSKAVATPMAANLKLSKSDGTQEVDEKYFRGIIGSLLYLSTTRPDIMLATSILSRFMSKPSEIHLRVAKRVLRYLQGTQNFSLWFTKSYDPKLIGFTDLDWGGCPDDCKSTSGYVFAFGTNFFCWNSQKQKVVAQSSAEAEYVAASDATKQAVWLRKVLIDLVQTQDAPTVIHCDNMSAIAICNNPVFHGKTKHIKLKFHFLREAVQESEVLLSYCPSENQMADIFTKPLPKGQFESLRLKLGVIDKRVQEEIFMG